MALCGVIFATNPHHRLEGELQLFELMSLTHQFVKDSRPSLW